MTNGREQGSGDRQMAESQLSELQNMRVLLEEARGLSRNLAYRSTYNTKEHEGTILLPGPHPQPRHRNNKSGNGKARGAKGDRNMQRGRSVHQVLCVNTEPCANAGGEIRGDLHHGVPVASALSPQAYEGLPEVVVEVVGGGGVGD